MNSFDQITEIVSKGNKMGLSNTIVRDYGIPLDYTSVYQTYNAAVKYAAEDSRAYAGQIISVENLDGTSDAYIICETPLKNIVIDSKTYPVHIKKIEGTASGEGSDNVIDEEEWQSHLESFNDLSGRVSTLATSTEELSQYVSEGLSSINVDKLVQDSNSVLILDSGII